MKKIIIYSILFLLETPVFANGGIVCSPPDGIIEPPIETE